MKTRFTIAAVLLSMAASAAWSQSARPARGVGLDLGFELAIPSGSHGQWHPGSGAALTASYTLPLGAACWYALPALGVYYNTLGNDYFRADDAIYDGTIKNMGLRIPLMVGYRMQPSATVALDIATGPWLNVNLWSRQYGMPDPGAPVAVPRSVNLLRHGFRHVEALWGLRLSATFSDHYVVGITASTAFSPMAKYGNRDNKIKVYRSTISLALGYKF